MKRYILIHPSEDGTPISWLDGDEIKDITQLKEDYGIENFLEDLTEGEDPNTWPEGTAMLLEVQIKRIVPVKVVEKYEIH